MGGYPIYFIGSRASWIGRSAVFNGLITLRGITAANSHSYNYDTGRFVSANWDIPQRNFVLATIHEVVKTDSRTRFLFESQNYLREFLPTAPHELFLGQNDERLYAMLESKVFSRTWMKQYVTTLPYWVTPINNVTFSNLRSFFPKTSEFILQFDHSRGCDGTRFLQSAEELESLSENYSYKPVMVTPYVQHATHANQHFVIFGDRSVVFQPSIQLIDFSQHSPYFGADFGSFAKTFGFPEDASLVYKNLSESTRRVTATLAKAGYRGVGGIDYLITENKPVLIEINARFQTSSSLLSDALISQGYPDLFELNLHAFQQSSYQLEVPIESLEMTPVTQRIELLRMKTDETLKIARLSPAGKIDGLDKNYDYYEPDTLLCPLISDC